MKREITSAIIRSLLIVGALALALKMNSQGIAEFAKESKSAWPTVTKFVSEHWSWILSGLFVLIAIFWNLVAGLGKNWWVWISQKHFCILWGCVATIGALVLAMFLPTAGCWFWVCLTLSFAAVLYFLWPKSNESKPTKDYLDRNYFVKRLAEIFQSNKTTLKRIAVLGTWGMGKTTVLKLLQEYLHGKDDQEFKIAFVNPWRAQTAEEAWGIVAKGFDDALNLPSPWSWKWMRSPLIRNLVSLIPLPGISDDIMSIFEGVDDPAAKSRLNKVNDLIARKKWKLVLLVDDMERADPEVIRKMFPVINQLHDLDHCFFVFAIDRDRIAKAFGKDGEDEAQGYLDKVFDLQIDLPSPDVEDVGKLCESKIDSAEFPKLAKCFGAIKEFLPSNPRLALKILDVAKTKEALFLNRYRDDEHAYAPFFMLWMMESEFPGMIEIFLKPEFEDEFDNSAVAQVMGGNAFTKSREAAKEAFPDESERLNVLFEGLRSNVNQTSDQQWLGATGFNLNWAATEHMRLLEMSAGEREVLNSRWENSAGTETIQAMIKAELPDSNYSDPVKCAGQFIRLEAERIEKSIDGCFGNRDVAAVGEVIKKETEATKRIRQHLKYLVEQHSENEIHYFDQSLFRTWVGGIDNTPIGKLGGIDVNPLREERNGFAFDLIDHFSGRTCRGLWINGISQIFNRPLGEKIEENQELEKRLRERCKQRVTEEVKVLFREGKIPYGWSEDAIAGGSVLDFFSEPGNWLPEEFEEDWLSPLRDLVEESKASENVANCFAQLVEILYIRPLAEKVQSGIPDVHFYIKGINDEDGKRVKRREYVSLLWTGGQSPLVDYDIRQTLLEEREATICKNKDLNHLPPKDSRDRIWLVSAAEIEKLFPVKDKTESRDGGEQ